jgi:acetyltransferase-like isoleucine patch superfamily enzyme
MIDYVEKDIAARRLSGVCVAGVLDDNPASPIKNGIEIDYLGRIDAYVPAVDERLILTLGQPEVRRRLATALLSKGAQFLSYVHASCYVSGTARLGLGIIVCPNAVINSGARCEDFAVVNVFGSVGHGATVGAYSVLSPYAALNGDAAIGAECFLGTRATIFPGVSLGAQCVVDSHGFVKRSVGDRMMIASRGTYIEVPRRIVDKV